MPLPKIETPIYELKLASTGEKIYYRPFLVREKKILMVAAESKDPDTSYLAVKQIVNNCTFEKLDVESLALFDLQHLFLKIRSKSIGEVAEFKFACPKCNQSIASSINFDSIDIQNNPEHDKKIMITDKIGIVMKHPAMRLEKLIKSNIKKEEVDLEIILSCIDYVFQDEEIFYAKDANKKELANLIESLTESQFNRIKKFFETMPKLEHTINYSCKNCNHEGNYLIQDLYGFFD